MKHDLAMLLHGATWSIVGSSLTFMCFVNTTGVLYFGLVVVIGFIIAIYLSSIIKEEVQINGCK